MWLRQASMLTVLAGVALAAWLTATDGYVSGGLTLSATCALGAMLRLLVPSEWAGTLRVRGTLVDVAVLTVMAVVVAVLTLSVPLPRP